jgi:hypothetical protein
MSSALPTVISTRPLPAAATRSRSACKQHITAR